MDAAKLQPPGLGGPRARASKAAALAAALLVAAGAGCTIIIQPPDPSPTTPFLVPFACVPLAVDIRTGDPQLVTDESPPTAQVIFTARIERTTTNLASTWATFMQETVGGLAALGLHVTNAVLLPLDERPVPPVLAAWGCGLDDPERLTPEQVLRFYAAAPSPPSEPLRCATAPLLDAGRNLTAVTTNYPAGLAGTSGRSIYGEAPDLLVVVHLDPLARRLGFDDRECAESAGLAERFGDDAGWLAFFQSGIPMSRVVHWFVATDEEIDDSTLAERCRGVDGFPLAAFDALEASPRALYGPLVQRISEGGGRAAMLSMCKLLVEDTRHEFILGELVGLASLLDVALQPSLLLALLGGDPLSPGSGGSTPEGDDGAGG